MSLHDDFARIDNFIHLVRRIDTFAHCKDIYELFDINKVESYDKIEGRINSFIHRYSGTSAPKYKILSRCVALEGERIKHILRDHSKEYLVHLLKNDPEVNKLKYYLDVLLRSFFLEGERLGISVDNLISLFKECTHSAIENYAAAIETSLPQSLPWDKLLEKSYYEILGITPDVDYAQIKEAYGNKYSEINKIRNKKLADGKRIIITAAWECLGDPFKRKKYDARLSPTLSSPAPESIPESRALPKFETVFGIDLGATFSAIAYMDEYCKPMVIPNQEGLLTTPSVVHFLDQDTYVVGESAVHSIISDPEHVVRFIKREMGCEWRPGGPINIYGREVNPQQISAFILEKLKEDAEAYFNQKGQEVKVKDVVITVPAYFGIAQKESAKKAAEIADLNVLQIINDHTAISLAFAVNKLGKDQTAFIFDLGGSSFAVTVLEIKGEEIQIVAWDGDPDLGGKDWDDVLINYCSKTFSEKHGEDPRDDPLAYQDFYDRILNGKITLSSKPKTQMAVSHAGKRETMEISRELFENLSNDLIANCRTLSKRVLEKANKTWNDIDVVLLAGGATYMPMIRNLIKEMSGKEPSTEINPDQCVVIGAAIAAHLAHFRPGPCPCCEAFFSKKSGEE